LNLWGCGVKAARAMFTLFVSLLFSVPAFFRPRLALEAEILALRHPLLVLQRSRRGHKLRLGSADRALWLAGTPVDGMGIGIADRQAGNRHRLASTGIPAEWEMEEPPSRRPPIGIGCSRGAPPENQSRQPRLGRSAHCWGTVNARPAGVAGNAGELHGLAPEAAVAALAHLLI
jgi:hypothetical protein